MRPGWHGLAVALVAMLGAAHARAAVPLFNRGDAEYTRFRYEHNKLFTADPFPVQSGRVQLSPTYLFLGANHEWGDNWDLNPRGTTLEHTGLLVATVGVIRHVDASIAIGFSDILDEEQPQRTGGGIIDFALGSTILFYHTPELEFTLSYLPTFYTPTGTRTSVTIIGPSEEAFVFDNRIAGNLDWASKLITCADIGYSYYVNAGNARRKGRASTSVALGYQVLDWLQPEVELGYFYAIGLNAPDQQGFTVAGGVIMPVSDSVRIDFGAQHVVVGRNTDARTIVLLDMAITF
ncbi:MAG TPA: transporter [Planctomycetota bacterium]|nr:transporter [Planctomycetota bacterium]